MDMAVFRKMPYGERMAAKDLVSRRPGMTVSSEILSSKGLELTAFSLDGGEGISETVLPQDCMVVVLEGEVEILGVRQKPYGGVFVPAGEPFAVNSESFVKFLMILLPEKGGANMETIGNIEKSRKLVLSELVDYSAGEILNLSLVKNSGLNLSVLAIAEGEALKTHSAPGDAMVLALDGEGEIIIDGERFVLSAGEAIVMPKDIPHSVKALTDFKMLLILVK